MVENTETIITFSILLIIAFALGGSVAIITNVISSLVTRSAFTNEPMFPKTPEKEEEIEEETQEERYSREASEFNQLKGEL